LVAGLVRRFPPVLARRFAARFGAASDPGFVGAISASGGSVTMTGTSPSTPSAVTMIECGNPSGPLPFVPRS
jgi:hypothetical protein